MADREKDVQIAETHRDRDKNCYKDREVSIAAAFKDESIMCGSSKRYSCKTSEANAVAIKGENEARIAIAQSEATRREREAEALRTALASEKQSAKALEESYVAEQKSRGRSCRKRTFYTECQCRYSCSNCKTKAIIDAQAEAEKQEN
jgi:flotillin